MNKLINEHMKNSSLQKSVHLEKLLKRGRQNKKIPVTTSLIQDKKLLSAYMMETFIKKQK